MKRWSPRSRALSSLVHHVRGLYALLARFNLHTIVRLPSGVFEPYTPIPTNVLFFDRSRPTDTIWLYEHPLPDGRKKYTKTLPLRFEEFAPLIRWWDSREETDQAWRTTAATVLADDTYLDLRHPRRRLEDISVPVGVRAEETVVAARALATSTSQGLAAQGWRQSIETPLADAPKVPLRRVLARSSDIVSVDLDTSYRLLGVRLEGEGGFVREERLGRELSASRLNRVHAGQFVYSRLFAWRGAFALVTPELDLACASGEFPTYTIDPNLVRPEFLRLYFSRPIVWSEVERRCTGTTKQSRNQFKEEALLAMELTLPSLEHQDLLVEQAHLVQQLAAQSQALASALEALPVAMLAEVYKGGL